MALGAERRDISRFIVGLTIRPAVWGTALGLAVSSQLGKALGSLLIGIGPMDGLTYALGGLLALAAAGAACFIPAMRAARTEPAAALRSE
jgi:ABC-type antimicrobial peptide transport system permease subunit